MNRTARSPLLSRCPLATLALLLAGAPLAGTANAQAAWGDYGDNPQHTALSSSASQSLEQIAWQTPVDLQPQYASNTLLIHYGCPLVSVGNTVLIPVKIGVADSFRVEARNGRDGTLLWQFDSDYTLPAHNWTPSYGPTLTPAGRLYMAGAGGTVFIVDGVDHAGPPATTRAAFYGLASYLAKPDSFAADVQICTPLVSDSRGNVFFGYRASGANPLHLSGGIARLGADGSTAFVSAATASAGVSTIPVMNCAPALSNDEQTLYVAFRRSANSNGDLVALNATTLATTAISTLLVDPRSGSLAVLPSDGTASPMVGPDNRVYFGVLDRPAFSNADRGWLLQFNPNLTLAGAPGAFGWDDTPSVVPASMVPSYHGTSSYLLMTKYNFYAEAGGNGVNKLAILDPNDTQADSLAGATVMKEVLTIAGVTPDSDFIATFPRAVKEWCINTAAIDPFTRSVLAGSEDGILYRWDLTTNTFTQAVTLTPGIGEAYTPTVIGWDGRVLAINNATLFSVGNVASTGIAGASPAPPSLELAAARPNPFARGTAIGFSLPRAGRVRLEILDTGGRRVARILDADLPAGRHEASWNGRGAGGSACAAGVYFARIVSGGRAATRALVLTR